MPNVFSADNVLTVRTYKYASRNPSIVWANTYEIYTQSGFEGVSALDAVVVDPIIAFEASIHYDDTVFDRTVVSTFVPDGEPYDPTTFLVRNHSGITGQRSISDGYKLPLNIVLYIKRDVLFGRSGKLFYRRCVLDDEVTSPAGTAQLEIGAAIRTIFSTSANNNLGELLAGIDGVQMVMARQDQPWRAVTSLSIGGVRIVSYNHRYYDRP